MSQSSLINVSALPSSAASFTSADANKQRPLIQGTQGHNSGNSLKRPRSSIYGRHHSPQSFSKDDELYRNDKRRKNSPSKDSKDTRGNRYQTRDHISSGRLDNRHSHSNKEVWSRLEIPNEREHQKRGNKDHHHSQSNSRHRSLYQAPQHKKSSTMEWRQRSSNDTKRARAPPSRDARHAPYARSERSRATYDSQRTISDNHVSLESGEMVVNRETDEVSETSEEERIRRLKGKAIATGSPTSKDKAAHTTPTTPRGTTLVISEKSMEAPLPKSTERQRYVSPHSDQRNKLHEIEFGLDQDLDIPITDMELADVDRDLAEVDKLVLETEHLEMDENMLDMENDDLLGDSPDRDAEQIEAISQLSPANAVYPEKAIPNHQAPLAKVPENFPKPAPKSATNSQPAPYAPKGLLKKKTPRSPNIKGSNASKKFHSLKNRVSPRKKTAPARNDKAFNGKDVSPLETVQIAQAEAESWYTAQTVEQSKEDAPEDPPRPRHLKPPTPTAR
ncbi:hypothetical protein DY000_02050183 [Brassica cretica]|uniref:DUF4005 domain-containing protein n=1 Tax=Brassica cretica TaxID=69181 RepID=A0ABQ7F6Y0_BRACR|nr:hypothetical protein DY000_02050183 [Brassica cretica]